MHSEYDVFLGKEKAGTAQVLKEGLYYRIKCLCRFTGDVPYHVEVCAGERSFDLGLCVPTEGGFGLVTRVPAKRLGEGALKFNASPRHQKLAGRFVPIRADEPFAYLSSLKTAFLAKIGGQVGAVLPDQSDSSSPTGQWSEPKMSE